MATVDDEGTASTSTTVIEDEQDAPAEQSPASLATQSDSLPYSFDNPPTIEQVQAALAGELYQLDWPGVWTPELLETTSECLAADIVGKFTDVQRRATTEAVMFGDRVLHRGLSLLPEDETIAALVECIGPPENFVDVFASEWAEPEYLDCLAVDLSLAQRVELLEQYGQFHEEWHPLLEDCGWVNPRPPIE